MSVVGHFTANIVNAVELCQLDRQGEIIDRDDQTLFCCGVPLRCQTDDKAIDVGVLLYAEVAVNRVGGDERRNRVGAVAYAASREAIPLLARSARWNLYDLHRVSISGKDVLLSAAEEYELTQDERLSDEVVAELTAATTLHREIETAFEKAKNFLESNLDICEKSPRAQRRPAGLSRNACGVTERQTWVCGIARRPVDWKMLSKTSFGERTEITRVICSQRTRFKAYSTGSTHQDGGPDIHRRLR